MAGTFDGITKEKVKQIMEGMDEDVENHSDMTFDEFKEVFNVDTDAKSIETITQSVTIRMNEVGPANWYIKVGYRDNGKTVHITREKKVHWEHPESDIP